MNTSDDTSNPFRPTFGVPPAFWVGRAATTEAFRNALRSGPGAFSRSMLISGMRGIGKTVLLNELEDIAAELGWARLRATGRSNLVKELVETSIPRAVQEGGEATRRRINSIGISGVGSLGFSDEAPQGYKPTLATQLRELAESYRETGVLLTVDEVQDARVEDLTELAVAYQDVVRYELNIAIVMAGLPQGVNALLNLPGATFLRRAHLQLLGSFSAENTVVAFHSTAEGSGIELSDAAVRRAVEISRGYPFLVQLVGYLSWNRARQRGATLVESKDIEAIAQEAISVMGVQVHAPAVHGISPTQREFLEVMAAVVDGTEACPIGEVAQALDKPVKSISDTRHRLIQTDLIEPAGYGKVAFTVPYLADYLRATDRLGRID